MLKCSWQANRLVTYTPSNANEMIWAKERLLVDLSTSYRLSSRFELMLSVRNIFNAPAEQYSNVPERLQLYDKYGAIWNFGLRGSF